MRVRFLAAALALTAAFATGCPSGVHDRAVKTSTDPRADKDKSDEELYKEAMSATDLKVRVQKLETILSHREDPDEIVALKRQILLVYAELGNVEKIEALAKEIPIEDDFAGSEVKNAIAYTYAEKGMKLDQARAMVMESLSALDRMESEGTLPPRMDPEQTRGYYLDTLGWIDHKAGKNREAAAVLEEAARRLDHATIRYHLGEAYRGGGEFAKAGEAFARAAVLEGEDAQKAKDALEALGKEGKVDAAALLRAAQERRNEELEKAKAEEAKRLLRNRLEDEAPAFSVTDFDGKELANDKLRATVTVLDFWASWCAPCKEELPIYQALFEKYRGRANFLAVSVDRYKEEAEAFMKDNAEFEFPVAFDEGSKVAKEFGIEGIPTVVVIGPCGRINWVHKGFNRNIETILSAQIEALLAEKNLTCEAPKDP